MNDADLEMLQLSADRLLFALAERAGVGSEDLLEHIEEEHFDVMDEVGNYGMEVWTVFTAESVDGQRYYAHLPGRLDDLLVRTLRDHSVLLGGQ